MILTRCLNADRQRLIFHLLRDKDTGKKFDSRWVICTIFLLRKIIGGMILATWGPIAGVMLEVYNDTSPVSLTIMLKLQFFMYVPMNFFANALIE